MPKETFFNLPLDKRETICREALREFASHPYRQASVNRIVARAGIAKGSFYQYFTDKKDLYLYLLAQAGEVKMQYMLPVMQQADTLDFFALLRGLYVAGIRFAREHPQYAALGRLVLEGKGTNVYEQVMATSLDAARDFFASLLQQAIARHEVRADVDVQFLAYLIAQLNTMIIEYTNERGAEAFDEELLPTVDQFIDLLKFGIAIPHKDMAQPVADQSRAT